MAAQQTKSKQKTEKLSQEIIVSYYMDYVLEHEAYPKSVYQFAKTNGFSEPEFYTFFGNLEAIKSFIWEAFYNNTIALLKKDKSFENYPKKEKLLAFYYTFFELLTLNRSYVLFSLKTKETKLSGLRDLSPLRSKLKHFETEYLSSSTEKEGTKKRGKLNSKATHEGMWIQFLFILKFWTNDSSPNLEKTDIAIEKSVRAVMDLVDFSPLESVIDFGKFLWQEKNINL